MTNFVKENYEVVMDANKNPLRKMNIQTKHLIMQMLGWMWSVIFCISFLSIYEFGVVWLAHFAVIFGITMTIIVFRSSAKETDAKKM